MFMLELIYKPESSPGFLIRREYNKGVKELVMKRQAPRSFRGACLYYFGELLLKVKIREIHKLGPVIARDIMYTFPDVVAHVAVHYRLLCLGHPVG